MSEIRMPNGLPLHLVADQDEAVRLAEEGPPVSFLLGANDKNKTVFYKTIRSAVGSALVEAGEIGNLGLPVLKEYAVFGLPKIPTSIVEKLDAFFRRIDKDKGTEAIVLLTFDPAVEDSSGWGVLVPKQRNSAASCKYEHDSVAERKDDNVLIVGSAHSHPGMSAFASHTDHNDQADFDGVHITYGWKRNSSTTEYHIELQMGGTHFTCTPELVFETVPEPPSFPELDEWVALVEKVTYSNTTTATTSYGGLGTGGYGSYDWTSSKSSSTKLTLPDGCPDPARETVLVEMKAGETKCPACDKYLGDQDKVTRRCQRCMAFLLMPGDEPEDLYLYRKTKDMPTRDLEDECWWWQRNGKDNLVALGKAWGPTTGRS